MEQAHEQPPASPTPGSQPVKEAKPVKETSQVKETTETQRVKPEDGVQGDKRLDLEAGMATAEYAIGTVAAAAFAGLLLAIIRSGGLRPMIESLLSSALSVS